MMKQSERSSRLLVKKKEIYTDAEDISRQIQCSRGLWINLTL